VNRPSWPRVPRLRRPARTVPDRPVALARRRGDGLVRAATVLAVVAVAGVAAYVSYWHAVEVVERHGERGIIGHLYPAAIDGLIVAASMVMLDAARHLEDAPVLARGLLGAGIVVTLCANVAYGVSFGLAGALWAAWPAVAFVGAYELLMLLVRATARRSPAALSGPLPSAVPSTVEAAALASMRATVAAGNPWSINALQTKFALSRADATRLHAAALAETNGHDPSEADSETTQ
jgi:Protein of unknown function (DUF2637)